MSAETESGTITLPDKAIKNIRIALKETTNTIHGAVMFEVEALCRDLGTTADDLATLAERAAAARQQWSSYDGPDQKAMTNMLAVRAVEGHVQECRSRSGRLRTPTTKVLAALLPRRTNRHDYFTIPDRHGDLPAGLTFDGGELRWYAEATQHADASAARTTPIAKVAFAILANTRYPEGMGGAIRDGAGEALVSWGNP